MRIKWLLVVTPILAVVSIIITYSIAVHKRHVRAFLPTISETGTHWPESRIFATSMNILAGLALTIIILKYMHFNQMVLSHLRASAKYLNIFALGLGCCSIFGQIILANYKVRSYTTSLVPYILKIIIQKANFSKSDKVLDYIYRDSRLSM